MNAALADTQNRNFNSIKVRLELSSDCQVLAPTAFQFHKGAIRTPSLVLDLSLKLLISIP